MEREVREETGLRVLDRQYLMSYPNQYEYCGLIAPVIDLFYLCRIDPIDKVTLATDELERFKWARPTDDQLAQMAFRSNRLAIERWIGSLG